MTRKEGNKMQNAKFKKQQFNQSSKIYINLQKNKQRPLVPQDHGHTSFSTRSKILFYQYHNNDPESYHTLSMGKTGTMKAQIL